MPRRLTDVEATERMRAAGAEPLDPYPGAGRPWRCTCARCGRTITASLHSLTKGNGPCAYYAGKAVDPVTAVEVMRAAGLEPLVPYPGSKNTWLCRCRRCGNDIAPRYNNVQQSQTGCKYCSGHIVDELAAESLLRQHGLEPLERYPGVQVPWRCLCLRCGRETTKRWNDVKNGVSGCKFCARRAVTEVDVVAAMHAVGLEPLDPYPGSNKPWRCRCLTCDSLVSPRYNTVKNDDGGCRVCAARKRGLGRRRDSDECAELMRELGLEPLIPYPGSNVKWHARHRVCGLDVNPTFHQVMSMGAICPHCAVSGFKPALPAEVYLITDTLRAVHKIGIGGLHSNRVKLWTKKGWSVYRTKRFTVGADAYEVEQRILRLLRVDLALPPYLAEEDGWTETVSAEAVSLHELWSTIELIAAEVLTAGTTAPRSDGSPFHDHEEVGADGVTR